MRWYGTDLYITRGETFAIDVGITDKTGEPYRISTLMSNAFFVLTVKSNTYAQSGRYILRNWINLSNFPKVDDMSILDVTSLPLNDNLIRKRVLRYDGKYYIYDDNVSQYVEYGLHFICTFDSTITKDWLDSAYEYDLKLVSGNLKESYNVALANKDDFNESPFENIIYEFQVINKSKIFVDTHGGD